MRLTRVTISGADDGVEPKALAELSEKYPFVEWGILVSKNRFGTPRYPSTNWLLALEEHPQLTISSHLCGELARNVMAGNTIRSSVPFKRLQLNGFSKYRLPGLLCAERCPDVEFILQCSDVGALNHARWLREQHGHSNIVVLWDPSGGLGIAFNESGAWFPLDMDHKIPIGYAGGIGESNIEDTIAMLCTGKGDPLWIDLESGARTDDRFDLAKVERILKLAAPFVTP